MSKSFVICGMATAIQDVEIWNNKVRVDNPLLCDGDGPINMLRKVVQPVLHESC